MVRYMIIFGWIGSFFGAVYAIPQAMKSIKYGNSLGISRWFILFWFLDKICTLIYVSHLQDYPLMLKYSLGLVCILIIAYFKFFRR